MQNPEIESYCCRILLFAITPNSSVLLYVLARKMVDIFKTPHVILATFLDKMIISSTHDLAGFQNDSDYVDSHVGVYYDQFDHFT